MADVEVRVIPRAGRDEIAGERDGRLLVRVTAPPVEGKANAAVCRVLAKALRVPKTGVTVVRGETARDKTVRVDGVDQKTLRRLGRGTGASV
jgi:uncharacterized protein (TIGR00251 family)